MGTTPATTSTISFVGATGGWSAQPITHSTGSITASGNATSGSVSGTVNASIDFTPNCFGCDDFYRFSVAVKIYVLGGAQSYSSQLTNTGSVLVQHPQGCSGTWGPHGLATWSSNVTTSVGSSSSCADGMALVTGGASTNGVSESNVRYFAEYPNEPYSLATIWIISGEVFQSDGAHIFDIHRRIVATCDVTFNVSADVVIDEQPPVAAISVPPCVPCLRIAEFNSYAFDPDNGGTEDGLGIASYQWEFAGADWFLDLGANASAVWNEPGSYQAHLEVIDDENQHGNDTKSIEVVAPTALLIYDSSLTRGLAGYSGRKLVENARVELTAKGWNVDEMKDATAEAVCARLEDPCVRGLWLLVHGDCAQSIGIRSGAGHGGITIPAMADCVKNRIGHSKELDFVRYHICHMRPGPWLDHFDVGDVSGNSIGLPPYSGPCPPAVNTATELLPRLLFPAGENFPSACPGATKATGRVLIAGAAVADLDSLVGVLIACPDLATCEQPQYVPVVSTARIVGDGASVVNLTAMGLGSCTASANVAPGDSGAVYLGLFEAMSDFIAPDDGRALGPAVHFDAFNVVDAQVQGRLRLSQSVYDSIVTNGEQVVLMWSALDSIGRRSVIPEMSIGGDGVEFSFAGLAPGIIGLASTIGVSGVAGPGLVPIATGAVALDEPSPNPFNASTALAYSTGGDSRVVLEIFDTAGRRVRTLVDEIQTAGRHEVVWNGRSNRGVEVASGIYLCSLRVGNQVLTRKIAVIK